MSINRAKLLSCLAGLLMFGTSATAVAQTRTPTENTLEDFQLFAPYDGSSYGGKPYLNEGFFFNAEYLVWWVSRPEQAVIGDPGRTRQVFDTNQFLMFTEENGAGTGEYEDLMHTGMRYEIGHVYDNWGWLVGATGLHAQRQSIALNDVPVLFEDPQNIFLSGFEIDPRTGFDFDIDGDRVYGRDGEDLGTPIPDPLAQVPAGQIFPAPHPQPADPGAVGAPGSVGRPAHPAGSLGDGFGPGFYLPYDRIPDSFPNGAVPDLGDLVPQTSDFEYLVAHNYTEVWGVEVMGLRRLERYSFGGHFELLAGVRFMSFGEEWYLDGKGGNLGETTIHNEAENNIFGPQFGLRWFRDCGRWTLSAEARAAAGANSQAIRLRSHVADIDPVGANTNDGGVTFQRTGNDSYHTVEFAPIGELRFNWSYQLTRAIAFRAGWTGVYVDGIARPSNMVRYILPNPKIVRANNRDDAFMHGLNIGVELNR